MPEVGNRREPPSAQDVSLGRGHFSCTESPFELALTGRNSLVDSSGVPTPNTLCREAHLDQLDGTLNGGYFFAQGGSR